MIDEDPLAPFHPVTRRWFAERLGEPTDVQRRAWPRIVGGEHVLVTAPTGSGKTLAAFLWGLDQLLRGAWDGGEVRVLYVSPLKALNNDIRRNLTGPLEELVEAFAAAGEAPQPVRVRTRSGDTPAAERQRMARNPPEILITTPESLNILLTSKRGRAMLGGLRTVILDEVHAVAASKRGTHLITAVERLVPLSGEFQRVALSATVRPPERIAAWVGGHERVDTGGAAAYRRRAVPVVISDERKDYALGVHFPAGREPDDEAEAQAFWELLTTHLRAPLRTNRSTLLFTNSRRLVERVTRLINEGEATELVYSHHGSLSREVRNVVEERLKAGQLAGIVATNSLELGIDIGDLDEVILVRTPPTVASAVQRVGRAGHGVGETSRGRFYPLFPRDILSAAVMARAVLDGEIEEITPISGALDVLAQVLLSMVVGQPWGLDDLFDEIRCAEPYRNLTRRQFDLVVQMLAGRFAATRVRELRPMLTVDRVDHTVRARPGAEQMLYLNGGTIPDRGNFHLRHEESMARLGELDEEFVWERSVGDTFTLGVQAWRVTRITHNDVLVRPAKGAGMAPFWRAEEQNGSFFLADRVGRFLETADGRLEEEGFVPELKARHCLGPRAADALRELLRAQKAATGRALPHRHHVVLERVHDPASKGVPDRVVLHNLWGGQVNRPYALALQVAWEDRFGTPLQVFHDDDCLALNVGGPVTADELLSLVTPEAVEGLLRRKLEQTGFFGARFREAAGRSLLLPRQGFRQRTPLWLRRLRAKKLLETVAKYEDFPILLETWRTCLGDEFDLESLVRVLGELRDGTIRVSEVTTSSPSPFAADVVWKQTSELMYEDDTPETGPSKLRGDLLRELVFTSQLRPSIDPARAARFEAKLQRTHPGYAPGSARDLLDWVVERVLIPEGQWWALLAVIDRDHGQAPQEWVAGLAHRLVAVALPDAGGRAIAAVESIPRLRAALDLDEDEIQLTSAALDGGPAGEARAALAGLEQQPPEEGEEGAALADLLADLLRFHGPVDHSFPARELGLNEERARDVLQALVDEQRVVVDEITVGAAGLQICDGENLERLLRITRAEGRPSFEPLPLEALPLLLATQQGLGTEGATLDDLRGALEKLFGFAAPAEAWEGDLIPARVEPYFPSWLDELHAESGLRWFGCGEGRLTFAMDGDEELLLEPAADDDEAGPRLDTLFPRSRGRFDLADLLEHSGLSTGALTRQLWELAWQGRITSDGFATVRRGIESGFKPADLPAPTRGGGRSRRRRFSRWKASRPFAGAWMRVPSPAPPADAIDAEERNKDRVRLLLDRYGVLFRELLQRELPALRWAGLFRTLRLMELSGEVVAGQFFTGIAGLQFLSHAALRRLQQGLPEDRVVWMSAVDPASPCGLGLLDGLPRRVASNHLVFHGRELVLVSQRHGQRLDFRVGPEHPRMADYLIVLRVLLTRPSKPRSSISVEEINGEPAPGSPYAAVLRERFAATRDRGTLILTKRY
jgi:ATP-dependent helicase Lhr and Lhr-like helicase